MGSRALRGASGPLLDWLEDLTVAEDVVPIAILVALSAMSGRSRIAVWVAPWAVALVTVALGVLLGGLCALLLGREFRLRESWGTLLGISLVGVGVSAQVGLSYLAVPFVLGTTLIATSRHANEVRAMLAPTERGALLPVLIVCGISIQAESQQPQAGCARVWRGVRCASPRAPRARATAGGELAVRGASRRVERVSAWACFHRAR